MALADIHAHYDIAAAVRVEHHAVEWPTMDATVRAAHALNRQMGKDGASTRLEELWREINSWLAQTTGRPMSASEFVGGARSLASRIRGHIETGLDSAVIQELHTLHGAFRELADTTTTHPGNACLEGRISCYGREEVYIAAVRNDISAVREWLAAEELEAEALTVGQLRCASPRRALILIGPPQRYYVSQWRDPMRAARAAGWLLTTPPACHVYVVTWPGHAPLDVTSAPLFPDTPTPAVTEKRYGAAKSTVEPPVWLPLPDRAASRLELELSTDRDPIEAVGFQLACGRVAFFAENRYEEPQPEVVLGDDRGVVLDKKRTSDVRVGTVLLFRPDRAGGDPELYQRADQLLRAQGYDVAEAHAAMKELKDALKRAQSCRDPASIHRELATRVGADYARHILQSIPQSAYIAPEREGAYDALRATLGLPPDKNGRQNQLLRALRAARRKAGSDITRDLIEHLQSSNVWQHHLEANGTARVTTSEFGGLELRVVVGVDAARHHVGRSKLGRILDV